MEGSLQAYIDRLPTEKIENFLTRYDSGELNEDFSFIVPYLQYILERRKRNTR